ncbi:MAG: DUF4062 domain-containing protein, partial [Verrucomicrobia bacterium]|nr:DUF4062 domain-containing protein [Verrucomicrobiota bacterium]
MSTTWQTARVFISSTFRDMHAERDHLVKTVFPALREQLAKYRVHLVDIDLRWGVTQEQSDNDLALDLCLEQIEDCRPFFIGLLGERYGYVPKRFNQEALSRYGWVQHYTDKSITELEILHGVLRQPRMHDHAFFFFRDPAFKHDVPPPKRAEVEAEDAESAQNLERLKQDIRAARLPVPPVENYPCHYRGLRINRRLAAAALDETARRTLEQLAPGGIVGPAEYARLSGRLLEVVNKEGVVYLAGLEAFGQRVHDQLWQAIQAELKLPEKPPAEAAAATDPLAEEADYHERFMESRLRVYVGRESIQQQLLAYANSDDTKPLLVTGPSGTGKSAVLARFVQSLQSESTIPHSALRIPHFVGASPNSTSLRQMLRRFCLTLRNKFGYTDQRTREGQQPETIPAEVLEETNKLVSTFQDFLKRVPADVRVVIVIDALNQLDETDNAQALHWLPWQLPPNVKMVLSCIEEEREEVRGKGRAAEAEEINREDGKSGSSAEPSRPRAFPVQSNSARQPSVLSAFQHRPHIRLQVEPLTDAERLEIVRAVPSLSAKTLDDAQIALLLENPATRNPLFLLVALEELRGFGSFERLNDRIRAFPREGDTLSAIFQQVIERLEEEFDPTLVRRLLSLLACARIGLSEQELQELLSGQPSTSAIPHSALRTPQSPLQDSNTPPLHHSTSDFFPVLRQLRPYLQYRGTLVDFYHRNLFKAVRERYLGNADTPVCDAPAPSAFQSFHYELANYFRSKSDPTSDKQWKGESPRPFLEVVFHLAGARLDDELCGTLCDLRFVEARCPLGQVFELQGDYRLALKTLPEAQPELVEERRRQERAALWTADIIEYSRRCNAGQTPPLLENIPSVEPWSDGRIEEECRRIIEHPSRLDRLREFAGFVESECYSLIGFGKRPGFVAQHAFNHSPGGSVHDAAARTIGQAREPLLLRQWPPSARHNPKPALRRTLEGHGVSVESVSVTADGRRAVSGSWDKTLRVWDLESGACLRALEGHSSDVKCVSVTADGRRAVSGSRDKTLRVWDLESGACLRILKGHSSAVSSLGVTADGRRAVSGSWDKTLRVWDLESGQCLRTLEGHSASVWSVSVTADGRRAVSGNSASRPGDRRVVSGSDDGALRVWDLESGQCLRT